MRSVIAPSYTFVPGTAGNGLLTIPGVDIKRLILVVDTSTQVVLYAIGIPNNGYSAFNAGTLTLQIDSSTCSSSDNLIFFYDDGNSLPAQENGRLPVSLPNSPLCVAISPNDAADEYEQNAPSLLGQSFDVGTGVRMQADIPGLVEIGANGGIKTADCKGPFSFNLAPSISLGVIDTAGYNSVSFQFSAIGATIPNFGGSAFWSNDGISWTNNASSFFGTTTAGGGAQISNWTTTMTVANGSAVYYMPCHARYLKLVTSAGSGAGLLVVLLRNMQAPFNMGLQYLVGSQVVNGGVAGTLGIGGAIAQGVAAGNLNPVMGGGVDPGALIRRALVDTSGRTQISTVDAAGVTRGVQVLPPGMNNQNIPATAVQDLTQSEGQSLLEIQLQILREMQINNFYMSQLAQQLNTGITVNDDPGMLRNETSLQ